MHGCCSALKYCCSCCRQPYDSEDPAKMTHSRMAFASRDLCCSVPKVSSDQLCLLASADSEGERGRTGVASVSERARASEGVCYFIIGEGVSLHPPLREVEIACRGPSSPSCGRRAALQACAAPKFCRETLRYTYYWVY